MVRHAAHAVCANPDLPLPDPDHAERVVDNKMTVKVPLPVDPWHGIDSDTASRFGDAVDCYLQEVIVPLSDMSKYWSAPV